MLHEVPIEIDDCILFVHESTFYGWVGIILTLESSHVVPKVTRPVLTLWEDR